MIFASRYLFQSRPPTIDELHQKNLAGELSEEEGYVYKGYSFVFANGLWYTQLQFNEKLIDLPLHFDPAYADKYVALSAAEMSLSLYKAIGREPIAACTKNETLACSKRPIVNC